MNETNALYQVLEDYRSSFDTRELQQAVADLRDIYRSSLKFQEHHYDAYVLTRMPATYSVCYHILEQLQPYGYQSLLDLGSGPGTVFWAAADIFPHLKTLHAIEKDPHFIKIAHSLWDKGRRTLSPQWTQGSMNQNLSMSQTYDLVTASYVLNELGQDVSQGVLYAWAQTHDTLVFVETGSPRGFQALRTARDILLGQGAYIMGPCFHGLSCPLTPQEWCHFSLRLQRSSLHHLLKEASLPYEDEKYSYLIVSKRPDYQYTEDSRILSLPLRRSGHTILDLCTHNGQKERRIISRSQEDYKSSREVRWGDVWKNKDNNNGT